MEDGSALLVRVRGDGQGFAEAATRAFGAGSTQVEKILSVPPRPGGLGVAAETGSTWLRVKAVPGADTPWDRAHALLPHAQSFAAAGAAGIEAIEPDVEQQWLYAPTPGGGDAGMRIAAAADVCAFDDQDPGGTKAVGPGVAWNVGKAYSQLAAARDRVGTKLEKVLIAHLDTGYDPNHLTLPEHLRRDLQRNFVDGDGTPNDASDQVPTGGSPLTNPGHGTGTLSLLAGNKLKGNSPGWDGFTDPVGGAPWAQILPVRIANWVVRFSTGTMVRGFDYARSQGAHVLSMSMGGISSQALVDAVNLAYDDGLVMVTAGGNNYAARPTPKSIVFPARLKRVLAACGVMADGRAYAGLSSGTMQGNYGPIEKMDTALGAYTPNVPWAQIACGNVVDMDGAGTSAATPQVAAAAALWIAEHWDAVNAYSERWMRIEAVRYALFAAALKNTPKMDAAETRIKLGQGVMQALAALDVAPLAESVLRGRKLPPGEASWSWLNLIFGQGGVSFAAGAPPSPTQRAMLALELTQIAQRVQAVDEAIDDPDRPAEAIPPAARNRYLEAALDQGQPSKPLRAVLEQLLGRPQAAAVAGPPASAPVWRKVKPLPIPDRRLRVFALDPSIAQRLASIAVNETVLCVPWDDAPLGKPLRPGPVGEYLEVVDVDPASGKVYAPVDLDDRLVLAQDGLPPSEGNPQFHQQMVYAVGMTTIRHFERALGRRALWAPRYAQVDDGSEEGHSKAYEVRRLRIYPHGLRTDNAYYSPEKMALLFGYFPANSQDDDTTAPGSMVFSCLSSDIIAHEMSHALLDGLHRRFQEASNPDVPAFHEAFADIVALFQHFTVTELVRFEIAGSRGDLSAAQLLGGLARQFGEGVSRRGPLRNYIDPRMRDLRYADTEEVHDRGSILVFAVYEAFLAIVTRRTADLIRIATGGTGVLPAGALPADLVERLTTETCKTAGHVLRMCIRALDYCPAVDITFGEYLRALITADIDLVPDDSLGYRVAFMEAFRQRGIQPRDVRTYSQESLAWNTPEDASPAWLREVLGSIDLSWDQDLDRSTIFALNEKNRWRMWSKLKEVFAKAPALYAQFGLVPDLARYDQNGNKLKQPASGDTTFEVYSVRPARRIGPDGSFHTDIVAVIHQRQAVPIDGKDIANGWFWFRGGATLILDGRKGHEAIRYSIVKNSNSTWRLERQRQTVTGHFASPLRSLYFGDSDGEPFAALHAD